MSNIQDEFLGETEGFSYCTVTIPIRVKKDYFEEYGLDDIKEDIESKLSDVENMKICELIDVRKRKELVLGGESGGMRVCFSYYEDEETRGMVEWRQSVLCRYIIYLQQLITQRGQKSIKELEFVHGALLQWQASKNSIHPNLYPDNLYIALCKVRNVLIELKKDSSDEVHGE